MTATTANWIIRSAKPSARMRLFCFPYAGGGAGVYRPWRDAVPDAVEVCAIAPPGREGSFGIPAITDMATLVSGVVHAMDGLLDLPFALFGHSLGSLVAYETALALAHQGRGEPLLLIVSGRGAPHIPSTRPPVYQLPDNVLVNEIARLGGTAAEILEHPEIVELFLPTLRADFQLSDTYRAPESGQLSSPVLALGSHGDDYFTEDALHAWGSVTRGSFSTRMFPGGHFYLNTERDALLDLVGTALLQRLKAWQTGPAPTQT